MDKQLSKEEEKKIRADALKELKIKEERKEQRIDEKMFSGSEADKFALEMEKRRIKDEETERYYSEKGFRKYVNHHGQVEWVTEEDYNKRMDRKVRSKKRKNRSKRQQVYTTAVLMTIIVVLVLTIALLFVKYTGGG